MGRNDCESFTGKIVSTLIDYTSIVWYYLVFFSPSLFFETKLSYGYAHIERIYKDIKLQNRIVKNSKIFWFSQVMIPEYFLMRIPQRLLPIIFPWIKNSFLLSLKNIFCFLLSHFRPIIPFCTTLWDH